MNRAIAVVFWVVLASSTFSCRDGDGGNGQGLTAADGGCDPAACEPGQGCYDRESRQPDTAGECTCLPRVEVHRNYTLPDTCASLGLVCGAAGAETKCRLPGEREPCLASPGCAAGVECVDRICYRPCAATGDCPSRADSCQPDSLGAATTHCRRNLCTAVTFISRCAASAADDGVCIPVLSDIIRPPTYICQQTGTALEGGACNPLAQRPDLAAMCAFGLSCEPIQPANGGVAGVCRTSCAEGRVPCPLGFECVDSHLFAFSTPETASFGYCKVACDPAGAATCPPDELGNPRGCFKDIDGKGYCRSTVPNPAQEGAPCVVDSTGRDLRNPCAAGLDCVQGTCVRQP